ncbi:MAG: hypothetical protein FJX72_05885 [Armatimonadetes bacterium]|nr:hypothetical protein [Armatimonadota bacterium]
MNDGPPADLIGKPDWAQARDAWEAWWRHEGPAVCVTAPRDGPAFEAEAPGFPDLETRWLDPGYRVMRHLHTVANTFYGGAAFPMFDTQIGPGSLGLFLGCGGRLAEGTVWYDPTITDPEHCPDLTFEPEGYWWDRHVEIVEAALSAADNRYLVSMPDLIENLDTLAQLRGPQEVLLDIADRPEFVERAIRQINDAFEAAYDLIWERVRDAWGGSCWSAFGVWGLGRTAKVQCDICCAISPVAFRRFVQPALTDQCGWLDRAMFHLDGTQALPQLDNLLSIPTLEAIEWTPQSGLPGGGSPEWYGLYRRILEAGKSVQAIGVAADEVVPLLDATGGAGMLIMTHAATESEARNLLDRVGWVGA